MPPSGARPFVDVTFRRTNPAFMARYHVEYNVNPTCSGAWTTYQEYDLSGSSPRYFFGPTDGDSTVTNYHQPIWAHCYRIRAAGGFNGIDNLPGLRFDLVGQPGEAQLLLTIAVLVLIV